MIHAGKGEAIRIRAILRSLIPIEDLVGVISIPFSMPSLAKGKAAPPALYLTCIKQGAQIKNVQTQMEDSDFAGLNFNLAYSVCVHAFACACIDGLVVEPDMSAGFCPDHKAAMVLFLDRVYGIEEQNFLLHLLEVGFLPDLRAAASLDTVSVCVNSLMLTFVQETMNLFSLYLIFLVLQPAS